MKLKINNLHFKNQSVEIETDNKTYIINIEQYYDVQLVINQVIESKKLDDLERESLKYAIDSEVMKLLRGKDYCTFEIEKKLYKKYPKNRATVKESVDQFVKKGYIDNEKYLLETIHNRLLKFNGFLRIYAELETLGYKASTIHDCLTDEDYSLEKEKAFELAQRVKNSASDKVDHKVYNKLSYAGYNEELIMKIMRELQLIKKI